jgi:hypothetical protein
MADDDPVMLSEQATRKVYAVVRAHEGLPPTAVGTGRAQRPTVARPWVPFRNDSGETVPAFGAMFVTDTTSAGDETGGPEGQGGTILICDKPGSTLHRRIVFNGPDEVEDGHYGWCLESGHIDASYDTGTPTSGDSYGIKPGQWTLTKNGVGDFLVDGVVDASNKRVYGTWGGIENLVLIADSNIDAAAGTTPGSGDATIQIFSDGDNEWVDSGFDPITVYNDSEAEVESGKILHANYYYGLPLIDFESCGGA